MHILLRCAAVIALAAFSMVSEARAQSASFAGIGFLPGYVFSRALGVSGDGHVAVGYSSAHSNGDCSDNCEAARFVNGALSGLGFLLGGNESFGAATNADGSVIVGLAHASDSVHSEQAFRWVQDNSPAGGTMSPLPIPQNHSCSGAAAVSADGSIVVGTGWRCFSGAPYEAFVWESGVSTGLGYLSGYAARSYGNALSADGLVVAAEADDAGGNAQAARWTNGQWSGIGFLSGYTSSQANGANVDGSVLTGTALNSAFSHQAFIWQAANGGAISAVPLLSGGTWSWGNNVSQDGLTVVGTANSIEHPDGEAFRWTAFRGSESIEKLLTDAGVDLSGWALKEATATSANGTVIVGSGTDPSGNTQGWIATAPIAVCPAGTPGSSNCAGECDAALANSYNGIDAAASGLGYSSVRALQTAVHAYCRM